MSLLNPQLSTHPYQIDQQLINAFQIQKNEIDKMKQQNRILSQLNAKVLKKDQQIQELARLVKRYKKYYDEFDLVKATLSQKNKQFERQGEQNKILFNEVTRTVAENKQLQDKLLNAQKLKYQFIKQRNATDNRLRAIQQTFRQYQQQCKNKEKQLLQNLEKSYIQIKQLNNKIQELQTIKHENEQLKTKITNINNYNLQMIEQDNLNTFQNRQSQSRHLNVQNTSTFGNQPNFPSQYHSQMYSNQRSQYNYSKSISKSPGTIKSNSRMYDPDANAQIQRLRRELANKQIQLQRSKALNHELSIEFDKSVSKICEFEKELSAYRKQNHELKKTLSLFVEKEQYEKMHKNNLQGSVNESEESYQQDQVYEEGGYSESSRR